MGAPTHEPNPLDAALLRLRRNALIAIAACALGIGALAFLAKPDPSVDPNAPVDRRVVWTALALAAGSILTRRSVATTRSARGFVYLQMASILCAFGLALLGALLATRAGQWQVGLLYSVAAALLLVRAPVRLAAPPARRPGT